MPDAPRPLVLIRGFGGVDISAEQHSAYQGYNEGSVYPGKRGENYIYEGFLLRALKSELYAYRDATNVVGYYRDAVDAPDDADGYEPCDVAGTVVIDPQTARRVLRNGTRGTIWVYRYYDLSPRGLARYGEGLVTLLGLIAKSAARAGEQFDGADVVAHSMGGLVLREALRAMHEAEAGSAADFVSRVVTLGTPHRGIAFQRVPDWLLRSLPRVEQAEEEISAFSPDSTAFRDVGSWFPLERFLTVVGTDYRSYGTSAASVLNRVASLLDEGSATYNRSDGLVKQSSAQVPGAPRTFVHKCHGGPDSLVTSREAYEIAMRFLHGTHRVRMWLQAADVRRGGDYFGRSEYFFGIRVKPRYVDFELFHQSPEAENCYGPFHRTDLADGPPPLADELDRPLAEAGDRTTGWAGPDRLIWEGTLDAAAVSEDDGACGVVFRVDVYVGERDTRGIGFSDNVVFRKQYYVQAFPGEPVALFVHTGERYLTGRQQVGREDLEQMAGVGAAAAVQRPVPLRQDAAGGEWTFDVEGTGFAATLRLAVDGRT